MSSRLAECGGPATGRRPEAEAALMQRLAAVAPVLDPQHAGGRAGDAAELLEALVSAVQGELTPSRMWLLLTAVTGGYPDPETVEDALRWYELTSATEATIWTLDHGLAGVSGAGSALNPLRLVRAGVVVDVNHAAKSNYHTGVQQVIRQTMPRWARGHDLVLAAWTDRNSALRALRTAEEDRVLRWHGRPGDDVGLDAASDLRVPVIAMWNSVLVEMDTPETQVLRRVQSIAQYSGNRVVAVGYDCIPSVSPQFASPGAANRHAQYFSAVKHMDRVAGISASATAEFQGFADTLATQGLAGPTVVECELPAAAAEPRPPVAAPAGRLPMVLAVGSLEPRKNPFAILYAAQRLWRDGLRFRMVFIGDMSRSEEAQRHVRRLTASGHPIEVLAKVDDEVLREHYASARFTVFPSLHEGYGLPVAESLQVGTPVVTSRFGSTREIGEGGGVLLVDPRDDAALTEAMRSLLTDDRRLEALRGQALARPGRTWDDYAGDLWEHLIESGPTGAGEATP